MLAPTTAIADPRAEIAAPVCQPLPAALGFTALARAVKADGLSIAALLLEAGVCKETWRLGRAGKSQTRATTLDKLNAAYRRLREGAPGRKSPAAVAALVRATEELLRVMIVKTPRHLRKCNGRVLDPSLVPGRRRTLALYVVAVELDIDNAELGRAIGCTRQNVKKARGTIEALRSDPGIERLIGRVGMVLRGDAA